MNQQFEIQRAKRAQQSIDASGAGAFDIRNCSLAHANSFGQTFLSQTSFRRLSRMEFPS
jgi:hypothetical protein